MFEITATVYEIFEAMELQQYLHSSHLNGRSPLWDEVSIQISYLRKVDQGNELQSRRIRSWMAFFVAFVGENTRHMGTDN